MNKRTLILLIAVALFSLSLIACGSTTSNDSDEAAMKMANFRNIGGRDYLVYDLDTRVVYYMFTTKAASGYNGYGYSYFTQYISKNGKYCRYVNDEIVEITEENTNN